MRILYGVQATGNGHITRARVLVPALEACGVEVDLLFSGREPDRLFNMEPFGDYRVYPGFTFVTEAGQVRRLETLKRSRPLRFFRDYRQLDLDGYDLVLSDFEPITAWASRRQGVPSLGIAHQYAFHHPIPGTESAPLLKPSLRFFAPVDDAIGVHWHHFNAPVLPPLIAPSPYPLTEEENKILVYLPFESVDETLYLLRDFPRYRFRIYCNIAAPERRGHLELEPFSRDGFQQDLCSCAGVIANAGFGLCSEAIQAGKKLLVKPLKCQIEQRSNAVVLEQLGLGRSVPVLEAAAVEDWLSQASAAPSRWPDVASGLAGWISSGRQVPIQSMADELWCTDSGNRLSLC
ncbi:MJ1255/VC2487 family glycosyltransferase [Marinobacterium sediminicola]|uniref:Glycosyltransferase n=1 Tax=Marinobacterium sediminicola TaxID=518898 RepID=A0ABY1RZ00_9GAMM|nr:MJ1255/VC2487 family glycosyltransferase [Marinobacterium sediminicola]ULG69171.1 hypothetical protein LN244_16060 [Marinobacterium sediminicola]SMR73547.1 conserved hypothetical protein [Marinobacterium sediminicola]